MEPVALIYLLQTYVLIFVVMEQLALLLETYICFIYYFIILLFCLGIETRKVFISS